MSALHGNYKVHVGLVSTGYLNGAAIQDVIAEGMTFCASVRFFKDWAVERTGPHVLLKTDLGTPSAWHAHSSATHPEVLSALMSAIQKISPHAHFSAIANESSLHFDERYRFLHAQGYAALESKHRDHLRLLHSRRHKNTLYYLSKDEVLAPLQTVKQPIPNLRTINTIEESALYSWSNFRVFCPKIKNNVLSNGFSGSLKLNHSTDGFALHELGYSIDALRTADLLEVGFPNLTVSDGIVVPFGGSQHTQKNHELGLVLTANNPVAHDFVAALILNLDPMKIDHLRVAAERGWGPREFSQIEFGGAGKEGLKLLSDKCQSWEKAFISVSKLPSRFEKENPGLQLPFEILAGDADDVSGGPGHLLDWLYTFYDFDHLRLKMAHWPAISFCVGAFTEMPKHKIIFTIGNRAIQTLRAMTSFSLFRFGAFGIELRKVQLKDGARHWVIGVLGADGRSVPHPLTLSMAVFLGTLGRVRSPLLRISWLLQKLKGQGRKAKPLDSIRTSLLKHNSWWALQLAPLRWPTEHSRREENVSNTDH